MTKLNISVKVSDYGINTWAYAISAKTLKKIQNFETAHETLELVINEFIGSELVSWGYILIVIRCQQLILKQAMNFL